MNTQTLKILSPFMLPFSFFLVTATSVFGWSLYPEKPGWYYLPFGCLALCILDILNRGFVRSAERLHAAEQTSFYLRMCLTAMAIVSSASIVSLIYIDQSNLDVSWYMLSRKGAGILVSVTMIVFGNWLPKLPSPWRYSHEPFDWQGVHLFCGRVLVLAGAASIFVFLVLPFSEGRSIAASIIFVASAIIVARKFYSLATWRSCRGG